MLVKRVNKYGSDDLNVIYRPCTLDEMVGNETSVAVIKNQLDAKKFSHTNLFTGDPGCGKTTVARIVALGLNCEKGVSSRPCLECSTCKAIQDHSCMDVMEIDVGRAGVKGSVESVLSGIENVPMWSRYKVIIFDEAHKFSDSAKSALFKSIEDGYNHVYFIFCTDQPDKLRRKVDNKRGAFLGRCKEVRFGTLDTDLIKSILKNVCDFEGEDYNEDVLYFLAEQSKGVPRDALTFLSNTISARTWSLSKIKTLFNTTIDEDDTQIMELSKALLSGNWKSIVKLCTLLLKKNTAEVIRVSVTGYLVGVLKRNGNIEISNAINELVTPIHQTGKPAEHTLYNSLFRALMHIKRR